MGKEVSVGEMTGRKIASNEDNGAYLSNLKVAGVHIAIICNESMLRGYKYANQSVTSRYLEILKQSPSRVSFSERGQQDFGTVRADMRACRYAHLLTCAHASGSDSIHGISSRYDTSTTDPNIIKVIKILRRGVVPPGFCRACEKKDGFNRF